MYLDFDYLCAHRSQFDDAAVSIYLSGSTSPAAQLLLHLAEQKGVVAGVNDCCPGCRPAHHHAEEHYNSPR